MTQPTHKCMDHADTDHSLYIADSDASPEDYTLKAGKHCWLTVDGYSIRIADKIDGVHIKAFISGMENSDPISVAILPKKVCPCGQTYESAEMAAACEENEKMREEEASGEFCDLCDADIPQDDKPIVTEHGYKLCAICFNFEYYDAEESKQDKD